MKHTAQQIVIQPALLPNQQYTNITTIGNGVYARARQNDGSPVYVEQKYLPTYYTPVDPTRVTPTHEGFEGRPLIARSFGNIRESREWIDQNPIPVYGDIQPEYMVLNDVYGAKDVGFEMDRLYIWDLDIEVDSENGFGKPEDPFAEVTSITVLWRHMGKTGIVVYGRKDYVTQKDELYIPCATEEELLLRFLDDFKSGGDYPDIVTGWNVQFYDIPYLVARLKKLFTQTTWERISPFNRMAERTVIIMGRPQIVVDIRGIAILDYKELYQKFTYSQQESYRLDHIAHVELGKRKVSYHEYQTLRRLYRENHQKFIEYNIIDVVLVDELDQKLKLIELVCALAYGAKCNFVDCFKQVRLWDIMIYHKLRSQGKQIPPRKDASKGDQYAGAYVKEPKPGLYKWIVSFDVASMYPHIIREWNLSPETKSTTMITGLTEPGDDGKKRPRQELIDQQIDTSSVQGTDLCLASNGVLCDRTREGFIPAMLKTLYDERIWWKKQQKGFEAEREKETDPARKAELVKKISAAENQQKVRKVNLNSAYGAIGSAYFRFYDMDLAEAVTVTGQMVIRWIANDINKYLNAQFKTKHDYVVASDTDSVYVDVTKVVEVITAQSASIDRIGIVNALDTFSKKKIQPLIDQAFVNIATYLNVAVPCMSMVRDVIADNGIWTGKKHYAMNVYDSEGVRYKEPKLLVHGLEVVKSSTPAICRAHMKKVLSMIVKGATQDEIWNYVESCRAEFYSAPFEDVGKPSGVNGLEKYGKGTTAKSIPYHVKGALAFNDHLVRTKLLQNNEPIREGEKIKTVYLREENPFRSHVMAAPFGCPAEWEIEKFIDYDTQYEKVFLHPIRNILECAGMSAERQPDLFG